MTQQPVYVSEVKIERVAGVLRRAFLPARERPVLFGVHSAIAEHYGISPEGLEPHPTTLDYVVAAAAGWLTGTFAGALEARRVEAGEGRLWSEARGEVVVDDRVLVIRRIKVTYHLRAPADQRPVIERVLAVHADHCPVARTLRGCVEIATRLELEG